MSIFRKLEQALRPALKGLAAAAPVIPGLGPIATAATAIRAARAAINPVGSRLEAAAGLPYSAYNTGLQSSTKGIGKVSILPALPAIAGAAGRVGSVAGRALRRYGGAAGAIATAGAVLYDAAGNPVKVAKRPRRKGITATELKSFTRVTGILNKYCKTPPPMKRRTRSAKTCR